MPGDGVANRYADLRRQEAQTPKMLYAVDATVPPSSPAADVAKLTEAATAAVQAGDGPPLAVSPLPFPHDAATSVPALAAPPPPLPPRPEADPIAPHPLPA